MTILLAEQQIANLGLSGCAGGSLPGAQEISLGGFGRRARHSASSATAANTAAV
ncbi:MAG TPA: hypothetical protein VMD98_06100 [Bryocella sp.]|nr:hypothetical protein [Bryocella sp.]